MSGKGKINSLPGYITGIDRKLVKRITKRRKAHEEWICTRHDACPCDGSNCIYPCTCNMKKKTHIQGLEVGSEDVDHIVSTRTELSLEIVRCSCGWVNFVDDYQEACKKAKDHLKSNLLNVY